MAASGRFFVSLLPSAYVHIMFSFARAMGVAMMTGWAQRAYQLRERFATERVPAACRRWSGFGAEEGMYVELD